MQMNFMFA